MKRNVLFLAKGTLLAGIILGLLLGLNRLMLPKFYYNETWSTSSTAAGFYQLPENSVDVLALGSSQMVADFVPQVLYDEYGITSYSLTSDQQSLLLSYYWLVDALETQSPKVVLLDTYLLHDYVPEEPLNCNESALRKVLDYMPWGNAKLGAVLDLARLDPKQDPWSYLFTNIRYHTRWQGMTQLDFSLAQLETQTQLKGFVALDVAGQTHDWYTTFQQDLTVEGAGMQPIMVEYLDRVVELCRQRGIQLILIKTPTGKQTQARNRDVTLYAREKGIPFLDFNLEENYQAIGYEFMADMADWEHANPRGATKITRYLGRMLRQEYGLESHQDPAWEETREYWQQTYSRFAISTGTDLTEYLTQVSKGPYTLFLSVNDEGSTGITPQVVAAMKKMGFNLSLEGAFRSSYLGIWDQGQVTEQRSMDLLTMEGTTQSGIRYSLMSGGYEAGSGSSILLDGQEYSLDRRGLNVVVYDHYFQKVIDSVNFDTGALEAIAYRPMAEEA